MAGAIPTTLDVEIGEDNSKREDEKMNRREIYGTRRNKREFIRTGEIGI